MQGQTQLIQSFNVKLLVIVYESYEWYVRGGGDKCSAELDL